MSDQIELRELPIRFKNLIIIPRDIFFQDLGTIFGAVLLDDIQKKECFKNYENRFT